MEYGKLVVLTAEQIGYTASTAIGMMTEYAYFMRIAREMVSGTNIYIFEELTPSSYALFR